LVIAVAAIVAGVLQATKANSQVQTCVWPHTCSVSAPITTPCPAGKVCNQ
jgi:hypothetical protein